MRRNSHGQRTRRVSGVSLIELLVVVAVMALLAALILPAANTARDAAWRGVAMHNLRQIGVALHGYVADHGGRLPGRLWMGQIPVVDHTRDGRLALILAPYLEMENPQTGDVAAIFLPPAFRAWWRGNGDLAEPRTYVMNEFVPLPDGTVLDPWGNLAVANPDSVRPRMLAEVPAAAWALSDADQLHPRVRNAIWARFTPEQVLHGRKRLALTFGGQAVAIPESELEIPPQ